MAPRRRAATPQELEGEVEELEKTDDEVQLEDGWSDDSESPSVPTSRRSRRGKGGGQGQGGGASEEAGDSAGSSEAGAASDNGDEDLDPEPSSIRRKAAQQNAQAAPAAPAACCASDLAEKRLTKPLERRRGSDTTHASHTLLQSSAAVRRDRNPPYAYPVLHPPAERHGAASSGSLPVHKRNKGSASKRYLMALPGSFAPVAGGEIGTVEKLDSLTPEVVLDWPLKGKLKLRGTMAYPKSRYLVLQRKGLQMLCEDELDQLLLFSEVTWVDAAGDVAGVSTAQSSSTSIPETITNRLHKGVRVASDDLAGRQAWLRSRENQPVGADGSASGVQFAGASCSRLQGSATSGGQRIITGGIDASPTSSSDEQAPTTTSLSASGVTGVSAVRTPARASAKKSPTKAAGRSKAASRPLDPAGKKKIVNKGTPKRSRPSTDESSDDDSASDYARDKTVSAVSSTEPTQRSRRSAGSTPKSYAEESEEDDSDS